MFLRLPQPPPPLPPHQALLSQPEPPKPPQQAPQNQLSRQALPPPRLFRAGPKVDLTSTRNVLSIKHILGNDSQYFILIINKYLMNVCLNKLFLQNSIILIQSYLNILSVHAYM